MSKPNIRPSVQRRCVAALLGSGLLGIGSPAAALDVLRHVEHPQFGQVSLLLPADWREELRPGPAAGAITLRLLPPIRGQFDLEIVVAPIDALQQDALRRRDLEGYLQAALAEALPQSVEGRITPQRFGLRRDESLVARLTDKAPPPGDFQIISQGVRLLGRRALLFTLYSNDADGSLLRRVLDLVSSFTFER